MVAAALWNMVGKAANLAQFLGLDAATLVTVALTFLLRFHHVNKKECRKLEGRVRMLRVLLLSSAGARWMITQQQLLVELDELLQVANVLRDASDLVESYRRSTAYARIVVSRGMATRFRELRSRVDSCCHLILAVNAFLVVVQVQVQPNQNNDPAAPAPSSLVVRAEGHDDDDVVVPGVRVPAPSSAGDSVHGAESLSTTTTPAHGGDTHVIDIPPFQPERNV